MLANGNLNTIEVLICKALIESYIVHDEFVSVNYVLREYDDVKETIKSPKTSVVYQKIQTIFKKTISYCLKCWKNIESKILSIPKKTKGKLMLLSKREVSD